MGYTHNENVSYQAESEMLNNQLNYQSQIIAHLNQQIGFLQHQNVQLHQSNQHFMVINQQLANSNQNLHEQIIELTGKCENYKEQIDILEDYKNNVQQDSMNDPTLISQLTEIKLNIARLQFQNENLKVEKSAYMQNLAKAKQKALEHEKEVKFIKLTIKGKQAELMKAYDELALYKATYDYIFFAEDELLPLKSAVRMMRKTKRKSMQKLRVHNFEKFSSIVEEKNEDESYEEDSAIGNSCNASFCSLGFDN